MYWGSLIVMVVVTNDDNNNNHNRKKRIRVCKLEPTQTQERVRVKQPLACTHIQFMSKSKIHTANSVSVMRQCDCHDVAASAAPSFLEAAAVVVLLLSPPSVVLLLLLLLLA